VLDRAVPVCWVKSVVKGWGCTRIGGGGGGGGQGHTQRGGIQGLFRCGVRTLLTQASKTKRNEGSSSITKDAAVTKIKKKAAVSRGTSFERGRYLMGSSKNKVERAPILPPQT